MGKRTLAIGWLVLLAILHLYRERIQSGNASEWMFLIWGMAGFLPPFIFALLKNLIPLVGGMIVLTIYELHLAYASIFRGQHVGGGWWIIEPIFMAAIFTAPAIVLLFLAPRRKQSNAEKTSNIR